MNEMEQDLQDELQNLRGEIDHAHQALTDIGVGKEHWSLAGRIDLLLILACQWSKAKLYEKKEKRSKG